MTSDDLCNQWAIAIATKMLENGMDPSQAQYIVTTAYNFAMVAVAVKQQIGVVADPVTPASAALPSLAAPTQSQV